MSAATVQRIWDSHGLQPHRTRAFKLSNDPLFSEKLTDVVGLYLNPPEKALVLCVDEKSQIQALDRTQPSLPMKRGRAGTMTHDYKRNGTTTLFAALSTLDGSVVGQCLPGHRHQEFLRFLRTLDREFPAGLDLHLILDNYQTHKHTAVDGLCARREALDERVSRLALEEPWWPTVARLRCFRGIDTLSALALHLEVHDWQRFARAPQLASWLGLTPSLYQSSESSSQGSITKTGSSYARRLLVEAAKHYARPPRIGVTLRNRQQGQPDHVLQIAWRAQHRLFRLQARLRERGKPANVAAVAVARELACFLWAVAVAV